MPVFTANIPALLKVGDRIEIGGKIKENARKMSVNLCAQEGEEPRDVVLHFDVRFHRDNIISLSRKNGVWIGSGNYDTNYNMFVPGTLFRIVFEIKDTDVITIYCQGKFHSNFLPKIPLSMAKFMVAWADVERITHCYFHLNNKAVAGDEGSPGAFVQSSPRPVNNTGDCAKRCQPKTNRKQTSASPHHHSGHESSDEDKMAKERYFYDALLCEPNEHKFGIPEELKRREALRRNGNRNYRFISDPEKNDTEEYSEDMGKNGDSSQAESEDVLRQMGLKKRSRRGKFGPFAQMVNFMEKSKRKN